MGKEEGGTKLVRGFLTNFAEHLSFGCCVDL